MASALLDLLFILSFLWTEVLRSVSKFCFSSCPTVRGKNNKLYGSRHNIPRPSLPSVGAEAPRAAEPTASAAA